MTEQHHHIQVVEDLRAAGYSPVEEEVRVGKGALSTRADVVAWSNVAGELRPAVLVEIKRTIVDPRGTIDQIANLANVLGTVENYVFDGSWHRVDLNERTMSSVPGPPQAVRPTTDTVIPREVLDTLVDSQISQYLKASTPDRSSSGALLDAVEVIVAASRAEGWGSAGGPSVWSVSSQIARSLHHFGGRGAAEWFGMDERLARSMTLLADPQPGNIVLDPTCGIGTTLWAAADHATSFEDPLILRGTDINTSTVEVAAILGGLCATRPEISRGNLLGLDYPIPRSSVDRIIAVPPPALRSGQPVRLSTGQETRNGDIALVDRMLGLLSVGGRLVVQLPRGFLGRGGVVAAYRHHLAQTHSIAAVIGLPNGLLPATGIATALVVIDRVPPRDRSLVADLSDDWASQLSPNGAFLSEYLEHVRA